MVKSSRVLIVAAISIIVMLSLGIGGQTVHGSAFLTTDKSDYSPAQTVYITGTGWTPGAVVSVTVTRPDNSTQTCSSPNPGGLGFQSSCTSADSSGNLAAPPYQLDGITGNYAVTASDGTNSATTSFTDSAANIDQCTNGAVGAPPESCLDSLANWVNGNSQGTKSHWKEGQFIAYRVTVTGLTSSGPHTLQFSWDVVHSSRHALDYIGSVNATETFSNTATTFNANNNNPCVDKLPAAQCSSSLPGFNSAASPAGSIAIPAANLAGATTCDGASGTFSGSQIPGRIFIWGASGTSATALTYLSENSPSGTGQCTTTAQLTFNSGSGSTVVIAWGGHIASAADWGVGNSAGAISGSPFHTSLLKLDGASTGSQDRALATSAIFFTPTVTTTVINDATGLPVVSPIALGSTVHDTTTLTNASPVASGTVVYKFYSNGACTGTPTTQTVTVTNAIVPPSASTSPLAAGSYSYNATYVPANGDTDIPLLPNSACEPFSVSQGSTTTATTLFTSTGTSVPIGGTVPLGTSVHDLATVTTSPAAFSPTGTVTYTFFTNNSCSGTGTTETVAVGSPSSNHGPLSAGMYSFQATYNGDPNYTGSTSSCEPFQVGQNPTTISTTVVSSSGTPIASPIALGSSVKDTSTISGQVGSLTITGSVTYRFYTTIDCTGSFTTETVTIIGGSVPNSSLHGPLAAGSYSFQAVYSGDTNYAGSTSACEPFSVNKASTTVSTTIAPSGPYALGSTVHDTATVGTQVDGLVIGGSVTYHFFTTIDCSGASVDQIVTLSGGLVPDSSSHGPLTAGSYSFSATYTGDSNYNGSTSGCEPLTINTGNTSTTTALFTSTGVSIPLGSNVALGTSVYDTATVTATPQPFTITGTVTYNFFKNTSCSGTPSSTETDAVGANSGVQGPLAAGMYSFDAQYNGDSNYNASPVSACEPFNVNQGPTTTVTSVRDSSNNDVTGSALPLGSIVHDVASTGPAVPPFPITGTVIYYFSTTGCGGTFTVFDTEPVNTASVNTASLTAGSYAFYAVYSGNANYAGSTSSCEPFSVNMANSTTTTAITTSTGASVPLTSSVPLATSVQDLATVSGSPFPVTGTVQYLFSTNGCTGPFAAFGAAVPVGSPSGFTGPLAAGSYAFKAVYSGDGNYNGSTSDCEPFTVNQGPTNTATTLHLAPGGAVIPNGSSVSLSSSLFDTATVGPAIPPFPITGTVTYFFSTSGCAGPFAPFDNESVGIQSVNTAALPAGTYAFEAQYNGNANYAASPVSTCEPFTVNAANTTISTSVFDETTTSSVPVGGSITLGDTVHDTATVGTQVNGFVIGGTVTYNFYSGTSCSGTPTSSETVVLAGGLVPNSGPHGPLTAGGYSFRAIYSGDSNYNGSTSGCESFSVNMAITTTTTALFTSTGVSIPLGGSVPLSTSVYDTATVTAAPQPFSITGTVTYNFFNTIDCSGIPVFTQTVSIGTNSAAQGPLAAGVYSFNAQYNGDSNYNASPVSACEPFTVNQGPTTTTTSIFTSTGIPVPLMSPVPLGTQVHDVATTGPAVPPFPIMGSVTYTLYNTISCSGPVIMSSTLPVNTASPNSPMLTAGAYSFQAVYSGDSNYVGSVSACEPFNVSKADTTTATAIFNGAIPVPLGSSVPLATSVHDLASVTGSPFPVTGTVQYLFSTNGCAGPFTPFGAAVPVGAPSMPTGPLPAGSYAFKAVYSGDSNYNSSPSMCEPFNVNQGPTTTTTSVLDSSNNDVTSGTVPLGSVVHDTATVGPAVPPFPITGSVTYTFFTNGSCSGTGISTETVPVGAPSSPVGPLAAGSYGFMASYSGDMNYGSSTSTCEPFVVIAANTTITTSVFDETSSSTVSLGGSITLGDTVHDTATVGAQVNGFVISGTVNYEFFNSLDCSGPGTSEPVTLSPTGTVPNSSSHGPLMAGTYSFIAIYNGDSNYNPSTSGCEPFSVNIANTTTTTALFTSAGVSIPIGGSVPLGTSVYDTATVTASPQPFAITGTVTYNFYNNIDCSATPAFTQTLPVGINSATQGPLAAGPYSFNAQYNGNSNYNASPVSTCEPFTVNQGPTTTTTSVLDSSNNDVTGATLPLGSVVHDLATTAPAVPPFPITGTVTYYFSTTGCGGTFTVFDTEPVNTASINTASLTAGNYAFYAVYSGNANYAGSTGSCEPFSIARANSTTTTMLSVGGAPLPLGSSVPLSTSVQDLATVTGSPFPVTGTVQYLFSTNSCAGPFAPFGAVVPVGAPSMPTGPLATGSYAFMAAYSGDGNYNPSISGCEPFTVNKGPTTTTTTLHLAPGGAVIPNGSSVSLGASLFDTAAVGPAVAPFPITGTVQYLFSTNGCAGPLVLFGSPVPVGAPSSPTGPLTAGPYAFEAVYSGDPNYSGSTSTCEPFNIAQGTTNTSTALFTSTGTAIPIGSNVPLATSVHDLATVASSGGTPFPITGTVTYTFFTNTGCSGAGTPETVSVGSPSSDHGPLTAGMYSFMATYDGDSNYAPSSSTCEPFNVNQAGPTISTTVFDETSNSPVSIGGSITLGDTVHDTATVGVQVNGFVIGGTVTYIFYSGTSCTGTPLSPAETVTMAGGLVPNSGSHGPLMAGSYSFIATYSGNTNYSGSTSTCEPFSVNTANTTTVTALFTSTGTPIALSSSVTLGTSVYDTATVTGTPQSFTITGTVTYNFYNNGLCTGTPAFTQTDPVGSPSGAQGPLTAGSYSFNAQYNGDSNYNASPVSVCEPFSVNMANTSTTTALFTSGGVSVPLGSNVPLATSVYDTATVTASPQPFPITGTVTYNFFNNFICSGTPTFTQTLPVGTNSGMQGPLATGSYSFNAQYNGDGNYNASPVSACEPFKVAQGPTTTTTALFTSTGASIPLSSTVTLGTQVHDLATVGPSVSPFPITGTVTYFFSSTGCAGPFTAFDTESVGAQSVNTAALPAGTYAFEAQYNGNANYAASPVSTCEPFNVAKGSTTTNTSLFTSTGTSVPLGGSVPVGTQIHDLTTVTAVPPAFPVTGTVTYLFSTNGCTGPFTTFDTEPVGSPSINTAALTPGSYAFEAVYNGNSNYNPSPISACEPFTVLKANPAITTSLSSTSGGIGSSVTDTATITGGYFTGGAAGTVTYYVYGPFSSLTTSSCSGTPFATSSALTVTGNGAQTPFTATLTSFGVYQFQAVYSGNSNNNGATSACGTEVFTASPQNTLTDTQFCPLTNNQFNLIYITDPANPGVFRMVSSNPGQFYDNVFDLGTPTTLTTLTIHVPYPFVTSGAYPIQVSSGFTTTTINGKSCFVPTFDQNGNFAISTAGGQLSSSGHPIITLSDYGTTPTVGTTFTTVTVTGPIPASGLIYVTIHLDYGLKGTTGWNKATSLPLGPCTTGTPGSNPTLYASWTIYICDPQTYSFSFTDGTPSSTSPTSVNVWKKDPGFAGVVTDSSGNPRVGATVKIYDNNGNLLGITTTDVNGVYLFVYKYNGPKVNFTIVVQLSPTVSQTQTVVVQSNKLVLQDFVI